jgi:hypothetical protein
MLIASILPWISLVLDLLNLAPLNIDYGAFAVTSSVILFVIAFWRYQFLNIKPLARDKVFELTNDGIIVLDTDYNIIDFNSEIIIGIYSIIIPPKINTLKLRDRTKYPNAPFLITVTRRFHEADEPDPQRTSLQRRKCYHF